MSTSKTNKQPPNPQLQDPTQIPYQPLEYQHGAGNKTLWQLVGKVTSKTSEIPNQVWELNMGVVGIKPAITYQTYFCAFWTPYDRYAPGSSYIPRHDVRTKKEK